MPSVHHNHGLLPIVTTHVQLAIAVNRPKVVWLKVWLKVWLEVWLKVWVKVG